jgi:hypothetical protein
MRLCANDFGSVATMDIPTKILDLGAEQPTAAELFWYPNLFWYTPAGTGSSRPVSPRSCR